MAKKKARTKPAGQVRAVVIHARVRPEVAEALRKAGVAERRTMSNYIENLLEDWLAARTGRHG